MILDGSFLTGLLDCAARSTEEQDLDGDGSNNRIILLHGKIFQNVPDKNFISVSLNLNFAQIAINNLSIIIPS